jgi:hypothetical protein
MKIRLLLVVAGLSIGFSASAFAQQKKTVDPQIVEQIDALGKKYDEAVNNNDAVALAALYIEDAVPVTDRTDLCKGSDSDTFCGPLPAMALPRRLVFPQLRRMVGNEVLGNGEWSDTLQRKRGDPFQVKGYWEMFTFVRAMIVRFVWTPIT